MKCMCNFKDNVGKEKLGGGNSTPDGFSVKNSYSEKVEAALGAFEMWMSNSLQFFFFNLFIWVTTT